jgi:TonB-linked SusC/RagA family outer membrane protein
MNYKIKLPFLVIMFFCFVTHAQKTNIVKGQVSSTEDNEPIPGVNIVIVGSSVGTATDFDGNFEINASEGDLLQFSYIGFKTQVVPVGSSSVLNIIMEYDDTLLDEIVVIGYGTQKRKNLTGAISKVKNENLDKIAVSRVDDALTGQVSGVNIQATEGEAGSDPTIRVRGTGSITSSSSPLIVVDGIVVDNDFLGNLDMNDIESFEVLKDASSAAIFGARGGNGVILISTKNGKEGRTKFTYNTYIGFKEARIGENIYVSMKEWAEKELAATGELSDKTKYKLALTIPSSTIYKNIYWTKGIIDFLFRNNHNDRDWQDIMFDGGLIKSHSFSARGGSQRTTFSTSLNYLSDEGVLLTDNFNRYSIRLKVDSRVGDKFKVGANISPSYSDRRRFDGSTHDVLRQPPWLPVYHNDHTIQFVDRNIYPDVQVGDYAVQRHFDNFDLYGDGGETDISTTSNTNPAAKILERDRNDYKFKLYGNIYVQYEITDGLKFKTTLGGDYSHTKRDRWQGVKASRNGVAATRLDLSNLKRLHIVSDNIFTYDKTRGKHEINAVAGFSAEQWDYEIEAATGIGYTSDLVRTLSAATTIAEATSEEYQQRLMSYFGRVNYAYDNKYLLSISARKDGYSAFGPDSKYGFFPAVSAGWTLSNEDYLRDSKMINYLKLRASYGLTGNNAFDIGSGDFRNQINSYPYLSLIGSSSASFNNSIVNGFNPLNISNASLGWEKSVEVNPGIDFGLFNNRLTGSVDVYKRTSEDLLLDVPVSYTTGFPNALDNRGKVENRGIEIELKTKNVIRPNFQWNSTFIASRNENELLDFAESDGLITNVDTKRAAEWINLVGNPISSFYGWVVDTEIPAEYIKSPWERVRQTNREVYVKDLNGDGVIDDDDKTILGNPYPDLVWSISNEFNVGDFDLSFIFQGSHGAEVRNIGDQYLFRHFGSSATALSSAPNQGFIKQKIFTDSIVQNASYVALRTISIGYDFPEDLLSGLFITNARIYATGQNLLYITADDYNGLNPESIYNTSPINYGYQRVGSPINQTFSLGFNLNF